jgi:hypothetical protein
MQMAEPPPRVMGVVWTPPKLGLGVAKAKMGVTDYPYVAQSHPYNFYFYFLKKSLKIKEIW